MTTAPKALAQKDLLRLLTCGSVDDGKSTLIGRLLYETGQIPDDILLAIERDSKTHGTTGGNFDPALLTDGLKAEREQKITIDVAYRYFETHKRKFIIADTPGHVEYTRNMATGASLANLAIILVDAKKGITEQTKRHSFIASLLGIQHIVVAINKMDLIEYSQEIFENICTEFSNFTARLSINDVHFIPISALIGDNIVQKSTHMPWYQSTTLLNHLEKVHIASDRNMIDFRLPVQYVNRPHKDYRGYCGTIASGTVRVGDEVYILPSKQTTSIKAIDTFAGELPEAFAGQAVTVRLNDELDISRGDIIAPVKNVPMCSTNIEAMIVWMHAQPLEIGKKYRIRCGTKEVYGSVETLHYTIKMATMRREKLPVLNMNDIGRIHIHTTDPLIFDAYDRNRSTGCGIIIDLQTNNTIGAFMVIDRKASTSENVTNIHLIGNGKNILTLSNKEQSLQEAMKKIEIVLQEQNFK